MEYKMIDILSNAIAEVDALEDSVPHKVLIGEGKYAKWYTTVPTRINIFRKHFSLNARILTDVAFVDSERVEVHASITVFKDGSWEKVADGKAEEYRGEGYVNKTSALENCETSAIGRALANLGMHGGEYASSFEVDNAKHNKAEAKRKKETKLEPDQYRFIRETGSVIGTYVDEVIFMKKALVEFLGTTKTGGEPTTEQILLYEANKDEIKKASESANKKDQTAYIQLIEKYESIPEKTDEQGKQSD